jgi:hypothetical protein
VEKNLVTATFLSAHQVLMFPVAIIKSWEYMQGRLRRFVDYVMCGRLSTRR